LNRNFPVAGCFNGAPYYQSVDYYFYRQSNGVWAVNTDLNDTAVGYVYCEALVGGDDPTQCSDHMMYYSSGWFEDTSVFVWDCGSAAASFSIDEECDSIEIYGESLCLSGSVALDRVTDADTAGETEWGLVRGQCHNEMPLFVHENEATNTLYFLWFEESAEFIDSNETVGEWMLSEGGTTSGIANCRSWDLTECTAGSWSVMDHNEDSLGFALDFVVDDAMAIGQCTVTMNGEGTPSGAQLTAATVLIAIVVLFVGAGGCFVYRRRTRNVLNQQTKKTRAIDEEPNQPMVDNDGVSPWKETLRESIISMDIGIPRPLEEEKTNTIQ